MRRPRLISIGQSRVPMAKAAAAMAILPVLASGTPFDQKRDPCKCLNWKQLYRRNLVWCGEALEYVEARGFGGGVVKTSSKYGVLEIEGSGATNDICLQMFKRMDHNHCVLARPMPRGEHTPTWCYVSKECKELNGGQNLLADGLSWKELFNSFWEPNDPMARSDLSFKYCKPETGDRSLGDHSVEELIDMADRYGIRLGSFMRVAYTGTFIFFYKDFQDLWLNNSDTEVWKTIPSVVQDAVAKKEPIVFDITPGGGGDIAVMRGKEMWEMKFNGFESCGPSQYCVEHSPANVPDNLVVTQGIPLPGIDMLKGALAQAGDSASIFQAPTAKSEL